MAVRLTAHAPDFPLQSLTARPLVGILAGIVAVIAVSLTVASLADVGPVALFSENGPVENLQAGFYGLAALCFGWAAWSSGEPLHRLTFAGLALFVACMMLREFDFTRSQMPVLAFLVNGPVATVIAGLAWIVFGVFAWRRIPDVVATGFLWVRSRGGIPLLVAAVLLLVGELFDHHVFLLDRVVDMVGEEMLELVASALVLLSAVAALRVSRTALPA